MEEGLSCKAAPEKGILGSARTAGESCSSQFSVRFCCRFIIERLKHALDRKLRCQWTGFRKDKFCADHITSMRMIIEQPTVRQTPLYMNFIVYVEPLSTMLAGMSSGNSCIWATMEFHQSLLD